MTAPSATAIVSGIFGVEGFEVAAYAISSPRLVVIARDEGGVGAKGFTAAFPALKLGGEVCGGSRHVTPTLKFCERGIGFGGGIEGGDES